MNYTFQFGAVFEAFCELLEGTWLTIQLSAAAMLIGLVVAILGALGKTAGPRPVRWLIDAYIEVIRNTPFLVQIFLIFFGLPALGLRLSPNEAALLAMVVNVGAYATEIIRAGIEIHQQGPDRSRGGAGPEAAAGVPLRRPEARLARRLSGPD